MLMLDLNSQLGNQMFQYAAVRTFAEQRGLGFCYRLGGNSAKKGHPSLSRYFQLGGDSLVRLSAMRLAWACRPKRWKNIFIPRREHYAASHALEVYDPSFFETEDWTNVSGGFQSAAYFAENRKRVIDWFTPGQQYLEVLNSMEDELPAPPSQRCCIHVRRTSYALADKGLAFGGQGWILPMSYYREALKHLPGGLFYVIVSDDPDFCESAFSQLSDKYISRGNSSVVDMFLLARCKYNIIANSSFSWWGAWCNQVSGRVVMAPKYHIGWTKRMWLPSGIEAPFPGWHYLDVLETLS
ncbi:MAG: O-antigen biosynthesis glycosyltransferase WbnK [Nitrosomonadaceae bacterium]|nr:O-antigen biosynthesis glycosyltransferase WbnK [Nitrosomonadaceae bacterium]